MCVCDVVKMIYVKLIGGEGVADFIQSIYRMCLCVCDNHHSPHNSNLIQRNPQQKKINKLNNHTAN